ncbi:hypothetical protein PLESTB_001129800 [Pleodorina starrii]|uniref:Integral membrane bound transporter domain-containing protein n=1 Tax=Pleodorina starrii TaxID=330485 RepID=A0A9W6F5Q4_9CHLO|nr:hypothetical protein PLESTB_001129800 [Pleodorina starrii]
MGLRNHAASIQKIKVDFSKVPDWQRRAARLSLALMFFGLLGHCVTFPPGYASLASNFRQSCNWAAITCIVVTAPVIGKVAQVAFDRLLGTAVGGFIGCVCFTVGFHLFGVLGGGVFISLMSGVTVWATTYLAFKHSLDQLVRFVQLTYCIVAFGAKPDKGALLIALLRVGGIFAGGLLGVVLAVLVLPRSASVDCMLEMKKALKALYDLNQEVWTLSGVTSQSGARRPTRKPHRHGYSAMQLRLEAARAGSATAVAASDAAAAGATVPGAAAAAAGELRGGGVSGGGGGGSGSVLSGDSLTSWPGGLRRTGPSSAEHLDLLVQHDEERESREAAIEKLFTAVYTALGRVDEHLSQTRGEIYIWHFWGRYFFLPGVHWFPVRGRWSVPRKDLEDMATCVRRVARMLWTLLLDFEEGFGSEMESVLRLYYPAQLLSELADYQARAILDLLRAFPGETGIEVDNLFTLGQVTDCLLQISDARARNTVFKVKRRRAAAAGADTGSAASAATAAAGRGTQAATAMGSDLRRSTELSVRPVAAPADASGTPAATAAAAATDLEKQPLLPAASLQSATTVAAPSPPAANGGGGGGGGWSAFMLLPGSGASAAGGPAAPPPRLSFAGDAGGSGGGAAAPAAGGGGGGMFISRLLSVTPGEAVSLHLPPRRYLQEQQQQQQEQQQQQQQEQQQQQQEQQQQSQQQRAQQQQQSPQSAEGSRLRRDGRLSTPGAADADGEVPAVGASASAAGAVATEAAAAQQQQQARAAAPDELPPRPRGSPPGGAVGDNVAAPASLPPRAAPPLPPPPPADTAAAGRRTTPTATPFGRYTGAPGWLEAFPGGGRPSASSSPDAAATAAAAAALPRTSAVDSPQTPTAASLQPTSAAAAALTRLPGTTTTTTTTPAAAAVARLSLERAARGGDAALLGGVTGSGSGFGFGRPRMSTMGSAFGGVLGLCGHDVGGGAEGGSGSLGLQRLGSMMSSVPVAVEPVTFPPTEEGYLAQVRWYSFQFVMDEMVNELEEAFHACSAVLQKLPYPIGN